MTDRDLWVGKAIFQLIFAKEIRNRYSGNLSLDLDASSILKLSQHAIQMLTFNQRIVDGVELDWLESRNAPPGNAAPRTPAGRRLFEHMAGMWNGENFDTIMKDLFPLVLKNIQKFHAESASESEATSFQQDGPHVDRSPSNLAFSHLDNTLGNPVRQVSAFEATFLQHDGLHVDRSSSNLAFSRFDNTLGNPVRKVSAFEATSLQQDGLHVDTSPSNLIVSHLDNNVGNSSTKAERGSEVPENLIAVARRGTEDFDGNGSQPKPDHIYTSLLKMHGDQVGQVPQYRQSHHTDLSPPVWSSTATFNGISVVGQGRNIKAAKHEASRQLCTRLGLD